MTTTNIPAAFVNRRRFLQFAAVSVPVIAGLTLPGGVAHAATGSAFTRPRTSAPVPNPNPNPTTMTRPTGTGIYAIEDLGVGTNLQAALTKVATLHTFATLTLPTGIYECEGFAQSQSYLGFLAPPNVSLVGSGTDTIIRVAENSTTQAQIDAWVPPLNNRGQTNQLVALMFPKSTAAIRAAQFTVQGTTQLSPTNGTTTLYNGVSFYRCVNPLIEDITIIGIPGGMNSPPGETFSLNINAGTGANIQRVEVDGRSPITGAKIAACGIGLNSTTNVQMTDCYAHHTGFSAGMSSWQTNGLTTTNFRAEYNGVGNANGGNGGTSGSGINTEKSRNTIHNSPQLGYNSLSEIRYYAQPTLTSDKYSGDTTGHQLNNLKITDGGNLDIRIDNAQKTLPTRTNTQTPVYAYNP